MQVVRIFLFHACFKIKIDYSQFIKKLQQYMLLCIFNQLLKSKHKFNKKIINSVIDNNMKSYQKHIRFENIELKVDKQHPKDISRAHFKLIEPTNQEHKTKKYGQVNPTNIVWPGSIQFMYLAQPLLKFETICEHQYGYQIEQLKALYCGQIIVKPEDFFIINHVNVYNKAQQKCGRVSFMIKVIDREIGVKFNEDDEVENQERIKIDLVSRLTFVQANLLVNPLFIKDYEGRKAISPKCKLFIKIDGNQIIARQKDKLKWVFKEINKIQLFQKSDSKFIIQIKDEDLIILEGHLAIDILLKNKRFTTQSIVMQNQKGSKIGTLKLQMRVIQKKQILDLMYSPKKLEHVKMEKTDFETDMSIIKQTFDHKINNSAPSLNHIKKRMSLDGRTKDQTFMKISRLESPEAMSTSRVDKQYNRYFRNRYQALKFSQSKRFQDIKPNNPYISYSGQQEQSDFTPKKKLKGANFSFTERTDFTKPFKNHPGTGDYRLPSIWERP